MNGTEAALESLQEAVEETMSAVIDRSAKLEAVSRLFDLSRAGDTDNVEFSQLDSLVYDRLLEAYECDRDGVGAGSESIS